MTQKSFKPFPTSFQTNLVPLSPPSVCWRCWRCSRYVEALVILNHLLASDWSKLCSPVLQVTASATRSLGRVSGESMLLLQSGNWSDWLLIGCRYFFLKRLAAGVGGYGVPLGTGNYGPGTAEQLLW